MVCCHPASRLRDSPPPVIYLIDLERVSETGTPWHDLKSGPATLGEYLYPKASGYESPPMNPPL